MLRLSGLESELAIFLIEQRLEGYAKRQMWLNSKVAALDMTESQVRTYQTRVQGISDRMDAWLEKHRRAGRPCA